jgi:serine protease Do
MIRIQFMKGTLRVVWSLLVVTSLLGASAPAKNKPTTSPPAQLKLDAEPLSREIKAATSLSPMVKRVAPSVVNIYSTKKIRQMRDPHSGLSPDSPWYRFFFDEPEDSAPANRRPITRLEQSLGSGVIVTEDGYILTNAHVVDGADEIKVVLRDGVQEYPARLVGADSLTEVAVLKVEAEHLPALVIGDSDQVEVGDLVLAVGNPFGIGQTVTSGMVSATGRAGFLSPMVAMPRYQDFIQTDAAINPGNSGGALVDAQGRLVGVNTLIISRTGGNQGIGFAIPINLARRVLEQIVTEGKVTRGMLGVRLEEEVSPELAKGLELPGTEGALVAAVMPGTPADKAGVADGDFIVEFNGKKVTDRRHLQFMVADTAPGTKVPIRLFRNGEPKTLNLTLGELKLDELAQAGPESPGSPDLIEGVEFAELDLQARRSFRIPSGVEGVVVASVDEGSQAFSRGLRAGSVVLEVNKQPVSSPEELQEQVGRDRDGVVVFRVWRAGGAGTSYIVIDSRHREPAQ